MQQGNNANAERIFLVAVHNAEAFGPEYRRVAVSLSQLVQVYAGQGKNVEAEPVYLQAVKVYQTVHGEFHADVVATLNRPGDPPSHVRPVCPGRALADAGSGHQRELGLDHPDVALSVVNLAQLRVVQEQPEKAEPL